MIWAPLLGALSTLYDEYHDTRLVTTCLGGFTAAACLAALVGTCIRRCRAGLSVLRQKQVLQVQASGKAGWADVRRFGCPKRTWDGGGVGRLPAV